MNGSHEIAMRYYRLWIYTCNTVLFVGVLVFLITAVYVSTDFRLSLLSNVRFYHPTFIYGLFALLIQGGAVQTIGFLGAIRLNQKLLNIYWMLLLVLLFGDVLVGGFWLYKYNRISFNLKRDIEFKFRTEYSEPNSDFQHLWNSIQAHSECCGIMGPKDFNGTGWEDRIFHSLEDNERFEKNEEILLPWSCCNPLFQKDLKKPKALANTIRGRLIAKSLEDNEEGVGDEKGAEGDDKSISSTMRSVKKTKLIIAEMIEEGPIVKPGQWCRYSPNRAAKWHFHHGCYSPVKSWLDNSADALFVIGFCVIGFLKLTFLGLLKVEIKEMIQKIKVLQNEVCLDDLNFSQENNTDRPASRASNKSASSSNKSDHGEVGFLQSSMVKVNASKIGMAHETSLVNHVNHHKELDATSCSALLVASQQSTPAHNQQQNNHSSLNLLKGNNVPNSFLGSLKNNSNSSEKAGVI